MRIYKEAILSGLKYYAESSLDFVDCILAGYCKVENAEIATLDLSLQN